MATRPFGLGGRRPLTAGVVRLSNGRGELWLPFVRRVKWGVRGEADGARPQMDDAMVRLERWYRRHGPALLCYLQRGLGQGDAAEELLHDTFVQALRCLDRSAQVVSPRAWLFAIARNVAVTALRRQRVRRELPDGVAAPEPREEDPRLERMREAIGTLPPPQREALELRLRYELSYEEIAEVLEIPVGTVRSRLHHAIRTLRDRLTKGDS
jgi:RNA polymerase sigma-70 factor (ECF subfamily)